MPLHERRASEMFSLLGTSAYGEGYDSAVATAISTTHTRAHGDVPNPENPRPPELLFCQGGFLRACQRTSPEGQSQSQSRSFADSQKGISSIDKRAAAAADKQWERGGPRYINPEVTAEPKRLLLPKLIPYLAHCCAVKRNPLAESPIRLKRMHRCPVKRLAYRSQAIPYALYTT